MNNEIKEILDKLKNRKEKTLLAGLRECQLKNIEHIFITKEEYINKVLDYIANLQNNWYDLKAYCKLERHESNSMKEAKTYNEIITKMEQLEKGE